MYHVYVVNYQGCTYPMLHNDEQREEMLEVVEAKHATATLVATEPDLAPAVDAFMDARSRIRAGVGLTGVPN